MRRLLAIGFVWLASAAAWAVLGRALGDRSDVAAAGLLPEVYALWGPPLVQGPPSATATEAPFSGAGPGSVDPSTSRPIPLESSDLDARLTLEHRRKGLLWFPTYAVEFAGRYAFRNDTTVPRRVEVVFPIESRGVIYDGFTVTDREGNPIEVAFEDGRIRLTRPLAVGETLAFGVRYRTRGTSSWTYGSHATGLGPEQGRARRFRLTVTTNFPEVDFPGGTLSPSEQQVAGRAWSGTWRFEQIVGAVPIGIVLPERLNPGPLASKITFFAPVSLLFFFFVTGMLLAARGRSIHPMNYFLLACAFFGFHLLFAYLIDHLELGVAFAAASLVSVALLVSYARLFVGWRTAALQMGVSQLLYLVLFSFTFFWKGFTGLAITIGAIVTLFVIMQITGRLDWEKVLARAPEGGAGVAPQPHQR